MNKNKTILVVEDEQSLVKAISAKLELEAFNVITAKSIVSAQEQLKKQHVDVVWLDHYLLGGGSGLDLVHFIKQESSPFKNVPVFVVSNTASQEKVHSYMALGVKKYYTKSDFKLSEIVEDISKYLEKHGQSSK